VTDEALPTHAGERAQARLGTVLLGKYRLDDVLGVGGMASVYAATHLRNANRVAVKVLHPELASDPAQCKRFVREGYAANTVGHPGTARVLDDDTAEDGSVFLVMDLLDGETLDARWERSDRRLGVREVVTLLMELLDVLEAAHAKGIVHRDLKPENLFLTREGQLKVLDFGVARLRESSSTRTKTGSLFGTPAFMPPEQALGRTSEVDAQSDIWAVGATAFCLLAGRFVHQGRTAEEMLVLSATQPVAPLASVIPDVPHLLAEIIDRALSFDKAARWPNARGMREALLHADKAIRSNDSPDALEDRDDEKTTLGLPPEMTLRGQVAAVAQVNQEFTVEISTLRETSTVAGVESRSNTPRARRPGRVVLAAVGVLGIAATVLLFAAHPSAPPTSGDSASASPVLHDAPGRASVAVTPSAATGVPIVEPPSFDVEHLPTALPAIPEVPAEASRPAPVHKAVVTTASARPALVQPSPTQAAPLVPSPVKKRDPLAP
jgi:serine/threonine protein kinase